MRNVTPAELNRRMADFLRDGQIGIRDANPKEVIRIHTEPATYEIEVVAPAGMLIIVRSKQDPTFEMGKVCKFVGSVWDDTEDINSWEEAPMGVRGAILNNGHPVIDMFGRLIVLPKVYQAEVAGMPFFGEPRLRVVEEQLQGGA